MAKISNTTEYANQSPISNDDYLIGTDANDASTKTFKVESLINKTISENNIVYITTRDSPYIVSETSKLISCDTASGDITVNLPDSPDEGFSSQIINYEGGNNVFVTTSGGAVLIGDATIQAIRRNTGAISVKFQTSSGSNEYLITQDSRNALSNRVTVTKASDLSGSLSSTKQYFIDGRINMGNQSISVPSGGLTISGYGFDRSILYSSADNYTMFSGSAGSIFFNQLSIDANGTSSKVFNVDNTSLSGNGAIEFNVVNFNNCTEIGTITGYRQFLALNLGVFDCSNGFTFDGSWAGGARIDTVIIRDSTGTFFKAGDTLEFNSRFLSNANIVVPSGSVGYSFVTSNFVNDGDYQLQAGEFSGDGTYTDGALRTDTCSKWRLNKNFDNTFIGSDISVTSADATIISTVNTPVKMAGTLGISEDVWFEDGTSNNLTYSASLDSKVNLILQGSFTSGNNNQITVYLRQWDNSESSYSNIGFGTITTNGSGRAENITVIGTANVSQNDRLEIWVENNTGTSNITGLVGTRLIVSERLN